MKTPFTLQFMRYTNNSRYIVYNSAGRSLLLDSVSRVSSSSDRCSSGFVFCLALVTVFDIFFGIMPEVSPISGVCFFDGLGLGL